MPPSEKEIKELLMYCNEHNIIVIPFGAGSSVAGGITLDKNVMNGNKSIYKGIVCLSMVNMNKLISIDKTNMTADF
jgi:FAD/FMN-containing dehydrogenase